jgi:hypothetical protein
LKTRRQDRPQPGETRKWEEESWRSLLALLVVATATSAFFLQHPCRFTASDMFGLTCRTGTRIQAESKEETYEP